MVEVVCVGASTWDTVAVVDRLPRDDERILASSVTQWGGGPAATAAVAMARLGVAVGFCGVVGDDAAGRSAVEALEREGVDVSQVEVRAGAATGQSVVLVCQETSSRSIVTTPPPTPRRPVVGAASWVHADHSGWDAVRDLVGSGARVSLDGGNPVQDLAVAGLDLYAPTLQVIESTFGARGGTALQRAQTAGAHRVVATCGAEGALSLDASGTVRTIPGFAVDVVSTLGAGDVFHGALVAGLVAGLDLAGASRQAAACAAVSCRSIDGRSGIPDADELAAFLSNPSAPAAATRLT